MGYIYKITNLVNNKIYIGKTVVSEPRRWQAHVWYAHNDAKKDCPYLCNAINKYSKENFKREIIEEIDDKKLFEREIYWIDYYSSNNHEIGYNLDNGGAGYQKFTDEQILTVYNQTHSIVETAKKLKASRSTISNRLNALHIQTVDNRVCQYDTKGNLLRIYDSFIEATTQLGKPKSTIPQSHYYLGYFWQRYTDKTDIDFSNSLIPDLQTIEQYDLNGNYINTYNNAAEASRKLKINVSSIKAALLGKQITAGNFLWRRINSKHTLEEIYNKYLSSSSCCEIEEIDEFGNFIKDYPSCTKAEKELGWSYNSIKKVCDGKQKKTHNRYFRYKNPDKRKLLGF